MKKIFGIALVLAVLTTLCFGSVALAYGPDDPDDVVNVNWSGSGSVGATVTAGDDAIISFQTVGGGIHGSFSATDNNYDKYNYGVDTCWTYLDAEIQNGGFIEYETNRTDSWVGMYSNAGQTSYSYVGIGGEGSSGAMAMGSWTNFAEQKDCTHKKPKTPGGFNYEASVPEGSTYFISKWLAQAGTAPNYSSSPLPGTPTDNWAEFMAFGDGTANIDCMSSEVSGCWPLELGDGCGCSTNAVASFNPINTATFVVNACGSNSITIPADGGTTYYGTGAYGSVKYSKSVTQGVPWAEPDYSIKVD